MGAFNKKTGKPIPESLKKLETDFPANSLDENHFAKGWRKEGICNKVPNPDAFFFNAKNEAVSKATCGICPVREKCLIWALIYQEEGFWGGTTEGERRDFTESNGSYVESLALKAKALKKWFPLPCTREILDLAGILFH